MNHRLLLPFLLTLLVLPLRVAVAQEDDAPPEARKRLEEYRKVKLLEALTLTDEQMVKLLAREREFRDAQQAAAGARRESLERLKGLIDRKAPDEELLREMATVEKLRLDQVARHKDFGNSLREFLTVRQVAEYQVFEESFMREVRRLLRDMRSHRGRRN